MELYQGSLKSLKILIQAVSLYPLAYESPQKNFSALEIT